MSFGAHFHHLAMSHCPDHWLLQLRYGHNRDPEREAPSEGQARGQEAILARRSPHSAVTSERDFQCPAAVVSVVDFSVSTVSLEVPPTAHSRLEMILRQKNVAGEARFTDHWRPHDFEKLGSLFLFPSGQALEIRGQHNDMTVFLCEFTSESINKSIGEENAWSPFLLRSCLDIRSRQIFSSIVRLQRELLFPDFGSEIVSEALVMQIAVDLARYFASMRHNDRAESGGLSSLHLRVLLERIHAAGRPPKLAELAETSGLSVRQLTRGFRASKGQSIGDYIAAHRLDRAKNLLRSGLPIKQIAYDCGFGSPNHFATAFRAETGITPSQFQRND